MSRSKTWGETPRKQRRNVIDLDASNIAKATIHVRRARVDCDVKVNVVTDGPIAIRLADCGRPLSRG